MKLNFDIMQGVIEEDTIFCVSGKPDALWKLDMRNRMAELLIWIGKDEVYSKNASYRSLLKVDNIIVLIPAKAKDFCCYDIITKSIEYISYSDIYAGGKDEATKWMNFFGGYVSGRNVYIMGVSRPYMACVNIDTKENFNMRLAVGDLDEADYYYTQGASKKDNYVYIPRLEIPEIVKVDITAKLVKTIKFEADIKKIFSVETINESLFALVKKEMGYCLVRWIESGEILEEIIIEQTSQNMYWCCPVVVDGCVFLFQSNGTHFYRIDIKNKCVESLSMLSLVVGSPPQSQDLFSVRCIGLYREKIILNTGWNHKWYDYDVKTGEIDNYYIQFSKDVYEESRWRVKYQNQEIIQEAEFPLEYYLKKL